MDEKMLELLYRSFDLELSTKEQERLDEALIDSVELQAEKEKIATFRQNVTNSKALSFSPFFTERIMARLHTGKSAEESELFFESLMSFFKQLAIAATILIVIITGYNMGASGQVSLEAAFAVPDVGIEEGFDPSLSLIVRK